MGGKNRHRNRWSSARFTGNVTSIGPRGLLRRYRLLPGLPSQRGHPSVPRRPPGQPICKATRPEKKQEALKALKHLRCTKGCWCSFFAEPVIRKVLKAACGHRDWGLNLAKVLGHVLIVIMMITNELNNKLKDRVIHIKPSCYCM